MRLYICCRSIRFYSFVCCTQLALVTPSLNYCLLFPYCFPIPHSPFSLFIFFIMPIVIFLFLLFILDAGLL